MTVSIIITCKKFSANLKESIRKCRELDPSGPDYEILVFPDEGFDIEGPKTRVIPTGSVLPAEKRDLALKEAKGEILAFLDDDAYPAKDWLVNATRHFKNEDIAAVCGPAVTPESDGVMERASGLVYASLLVSARYASRYRQGKAVFFVDDYPSCNFLVRRDVFEKVGGFNTAFWPGEDTILCLKITKEIHKKILYDPGVLVYHHRRELFRPHLKQVASYALHRGYFAKRFPWNSLKFTYFVPSIFVLALAFGVVLSLILPGLKSLYSIALAAYLVCVFIASLNKDIRLIPLVFIGIILTHIAYGINFLKGLLADKLKEEV
ncbi:MAG: glycosyltransferase [Candidatus Omnitrophica bacterium]|nr:glycosyltransferase [Candidatus Omnitrophota bacterium]MDD5610158.1 glycosyltransferase [Candidatus Omnitrophota bacterium]